MSRYFTRSAHVVTPDPSDSDQPMSVYDDSRTMMVHEDVFDTWTGLYDARGAEIHRTERIAMGFRPKAS